MSVAELFPFVAHTARSKETAHRYLPFACVLGLFLVMGLVCFGDGVLFGVVPYERDTVVFYYPLLAWAAEQMRSGQIPLWAPQIFGGYPIFADGEIGLAYPPVLASLLLFPADQAFILLRVFHIAIAAAGTYMLARAWRLPRLAAILAGVTFALGSFLQAQIQHENIVRTAVWLPAALACAEMALRARGRVRLRWVAGGVLLVGLAGLGLHIQIFAIDLLVLAVYGLLRWWAGPIGGGRGWLRRLAAIVQVFPALALLGTALAAVQIIPLAELSRFSPRGAGLTYSQAAAYSLTPYGLVQLLLPFVFRDSQHTQWGLWTHWESYLYVGIAPLVLAALALTRVRRRPAIVLWFAIAVLAVLLALGQYLPVSLFYELWLVPGLSSLRAPGRFALAAVLALAMLAGEGCTLVQVWARSPRGLRPRRVAAVCVAAATLLFAILLTAGHLLVRVAPSLVGSAVDAWYLSLPRDTYTITTREVLDGLTWSTSLLSNHQTQASIGFLLLTALLLGTWPSAGTRGRRRYLARAWPVALILLASIDLLVFDWSIHPRDTLANLSSEQPSVAAVLNDDPLSTADGGPYRVLSSPVLEQVAPDRLSPFLLQEAGGYTSLEFTWHQEYSDRVEHVDDAMLDLWNVRYLIEPTHYGALSSYGGVSFLTPNALLDAPRGSALSTATFALPDGFVPSQIDLVTALEGAADVPQGALVGDVRWLTSDGEVVARQELRAGEDTSDWAWDNPALQHTPVESAGTMSDEGSDGQVHTRTLSFTSRPLNQPVDASSVQVRSLTPEGSLVVFGANVTSSDGSTFQLFGHHETKYSVLYAGPDITVLENADAFPRAFLVPTAVVAPAQQGSLGDMTRQPFDPHQEVVLSSDTPAAVAASLPTFLPALLRSGTAPAPVIQSYALDDIVIHAEASAPSMLVLSDNYYPGWEAFVDGQPTPVLRGDELFRAVSIPPGSHQVEFRFAPQSLRLGGAITLSTLVVTLALLGWSMRPSKRRSFASSAAA